MKLIKPSHRGSDNIELIEFNIFAYFFVINNIMQVSSDCHIFVIKFSITKVKYFDTWRQFKERKFELRIMGVGLGLKSLSDSVILI